MGWGVRTWARAGWPVGRQQEHGQHRNHRNPALLCPLLAADEATGRARQLIPDTHYQLLEDTLGSAYQRCANVRAQCQLG